MIGWLSLAISGINILANITVMTVDSLKEVIASIKRKYPKLFRKKAQKYADKDTKELNEALNIIA